MSAFVHVVLIGASAVATMPSIDSGFELSDTWVTYLPPPDPKPARNASAEAIRYVQLAPPGEGAGFGPEGMGVELDAGKDEAPVPGNVGIDTITSAETEGADGTDTVFTRIEVDSAAARLPESAAPAYPPDLLMRRVEGQAIVQFVVDTTGLADLASFSVVVASHPEFAQSVREALPGMRFSTARIGSTKVRQLVELPFSFNIAEPAPVPAESTMTDTVKRKPQ